MQNVAYELRISDWGSDVCSSDLVGRAYALSHPVLAGLGDVGEGRAVDGAQRLEDRLHRGRQRLERGVHVGEERVAPGRRDLAGEEHRGHRRLVEVGGVGVPDAAEDHRLIERKSVVSGKSVSVGVDLGGTVSTKNKNTKPPRCTRYNHTANMHHI